MNKNVIDFMIAIAAISVYDGGKIDKADLKRVRLEYLKVNNIEKYVLNIK